MYDPFLRGKICFRFQISVILVSSLDSINKLSLYMRQKQFFKSHYMSKNACYFASEKSWLLLSVLSVNSQSEQVAITPPILPHRSPRIRRRHNLHNYTSLASTNRSYDVRNSVHAPPHDTPTPIQQCNLI